MPRNGGKLVNVAARTVRDRNRTVYPTARLELGADGLYYARPIATSRTFHYHECWLLPAQGWVISRFAFLPGQREVDWYIETDRIEVSGPLWQVEDGYLDLFVFDGSRYEVLDADELADGIEAAEIPLAEALGALRSLNALCGELRRLDFSGAALLREYAPDLPH